MAGRPRPPTPAMRRLGKRVREEREAHNVALGELARQLDISDSVLWKIENGQVALTAERAQQIASLLGVTIARLYGERTIEGAGAA